MAKSKRVFALLVNLLYIAPANNKGDKTIIPPQGENSAKFKPLMVICADTAVPPIYVSYKGKARDAKLRTANAVAKALNIFLRIVIKPFCVAGFVCENNYLIKPLAGFVVYHITISCFFD